MSAFGIAIQAPAMTSNRAEDGASGDQRSMSPCLGLAVGAGLLSWLALGSLLGIVLA